MAKVIRVTPTLRLVGILLLLSSWPVAAQTQTGGGSTDASSSGEPRADLLSWAAGAFVVRAEPYSVESARVALDGDPRTVSVGIPRREPLPHRFVIELPAATTFDAFAVPEIDEYGPARGRHVAGVRIEGSMVGPDSGFTLLIDFELLVDQGALQEFSVSDSPAVRWLRVSFESRMLPPPADVDPYVFSELMGFGSQDEVVVGPAEFTGRWRLRRGGINDEPGRNVLALAQHGTLLRGCRVSGGQRSEIVGAVEGGVARLVLDPTGTHGGTPVLARVTREGDLAGASMTGGMHPVWASADPDAPVPCPAIFQEPDAESPDPVVEALETGSVAVLYGIHFDVDSHVLRADAAPALDQLLRALEATGETVASIEGHTDSDGSEAYNLDLSQRRARSVVEWLVERGIPESRLRAVGKGETEPVADNASSAGRALNRRVEVEPLPSG